ncbi:uncharacterized protein A4U43_C02F13520 [Asparagus officinalis]|uniref:HIT domain-containing protein n=1 Tax=Asparagus officinalis TaxID=4686 RepID=A0A5P1FI19_ASPOF|nr:uncharacterized protein A4U43_C02F13520 [Asparagus officinalis]
MRTSLFSRLPSFAAPKTSTALNLSLIPRSPLASQPRTSLSSSSPQMEGDAYTFGPYKIHKSEVFFSSPLSYAMVNLRPLVPVGGKLEQYHEASSLTFGIQDGPQAGQTVPHVHIHVIPRKKGDFEKNDEIYEAMDVKEKELKDKLDLDIERKDRSFDEMAREADAYRVLFS